MWAIIVKEIKSYFKSMFGWFFLAAFTFFAGLYYLIINIWNGMPDFSYTLNSLVIIVLFILPLLSMRIISEEKRQKTDQFLITAPISLWKVVVGKFLALAAIVGASSLLIFIGAVVLSMYGSIAWIETIYYILIFFIFCCALISVGMFMSSVTEHQFVAVLFTYLVYFFSLLGYQFSSMIFGTDKMITKVLSVLDIYTRLDTLLLGRLNIPALLYMFSVIAIFLLLTYKIFARNSVQISAVGRNKFFFSSFGIIIIIAAIVVLNIGSTHVSTKYTDFDITSAGKYSIGDETKELLATLDTDVTIYSLMSEKDMDEIVKSYLDSYDSRSKKIHIEYKPYDEYPQFYQNYAAEAPTNGSLIVTMGDDYRVLDYYDLFYWGYDSASGQYYQSGSNIESLITASIKAMILGENKLKAYYLTGHNELDIPTYIVDILTKNGFVFEELSLISQAEIPSDCDVLFINAPQDDLQPNETEKIKNYANNAGNIVMACTLADYENVNYDELINSFGVTITEGMILEENINYLYDYYPYEILSVPDSDGPFELSSSKYVFNYCPRGLVYDESTLPSDTMIQTIVMSSNTSYEKVITPESNLMKDETCNDGPFPLEVYVRKYCASADDYANVVILGSTGFMFEEFDNAVVNGNSELVVNAIKKFLPNDLNTMIPVKNFDPEPILVSRGVLYVDILFCEILIPLAMIIAGLVIVISRRRK